MAYNGSNYRLHRVGSVILTRNQWIVWRAVAMITAPVWVVPAGIVYLLWHLVAAVEDEINGR